MSIGQKGKRTTVQEMIGSLRNWLKDYTACHSQEDVAELAELFGNTMGWEKDTVESQLVFVPKPVW